MAGRGHLDVAATGLLHLLTRPMRSVSVRKTVFVRIVTGDFSYEIKTSSAKPFLDNQP